MTDQKIASLKDSLLEPGRAWWLRLFVEGLGAFAGGVAVGGAAQVAGLSAWVWLPVAAIAFLVSHRVAWPLFKRVSRQPRTVDDWERLIGPRHAIVIVVTTALMLPLDAAGVCPAVIVAVGFLAVGGALRIADGAAARLDWPRSETEVSSET